MLCDEELLSLKLYRLVQSRAESIDLGCGLAPLTHSHLAVRRYCTPCRIFTMLLSHIPPRLRPTLPAPAASTASRRSPRRIWKLLVIVVRTVGFVYTQKIYTLVLTLHTTIEENSSCRSPYSLVATSRHVLPACANCGVHCAVRGASARCGNWDEISGRRGRTVCLSLGV